MTSTISTVEETTPQPVQQQEQGQEEQQQQQQQQPQPQPKQHSEWQVQKSRRSQKAQNNKDKKQHKLEQLQQQQQQQPSQQRPPHKKERNQQQQQQQQQKEQREKEKKEREEKEERERKPLPELEPEVEANATQQTEAISLHLSATPSLSPSPADNILLRVSLQTGPGAKRTPLDVVCVVDVSGSMAAATTITDENGKTESHGLSVLDVVKHAVKTVICGLEDCDRVGLVGFDHSASVFFDLTRATSGNKEYMVKKAEKMTPRGGTDIWVGLERAIALLKQSQRGRMPAILLLTDGQPNTDPLPSLRTYKERNTFLPTIYTFGFGYSLQTDTLIDIAKEGSGMHSFIPDAGFVGTAFVNALSNLMVTVATDTKLFIEPVGDAKIVKVVGHPSQTTSWGSLIPMTALQYGQPKSAIIQMQVPSSEDPSKPFVRVTAKFQRASNPRKLKRESDEETRTEEYALAAVNIQDEEVMADLLRLTLAKKVVECVKECRFGCGSKDAKNKLRVAKLNTLTSRIQHPLVEGIKLDLEGQIKEALLRDYFQKWGQHYLPSLARAHLLQQCNNFKDPGIQNYGGELFQHLRERIENLFVQLPPPQPSVRGKHHAKLGSMRKYYNRSGGCIDGECTVVLANGQTKRVCELVKGDRVGKGEIVCVAEMMCEGGTEQLVTLPGGLRITPYHPVQTEDGTWSFPIDLAAVKEEKCTAVYNFVLSEHHSMVVNGTECVTLGHNMEGKVVSHPFFGTEKVIKEMERMRGWEEGRVKVRGFVRESENGLVCGMLGAVNTPAR